MMADIVMELPADTELPFASTRPSPSGGEGVAFTPAVKLDGRTRPVGEIAPVAAKYGALFTALAPVYEGRLHRLRTAMVAESDCQ